MGKREDIDREVYQWALGQKSKGVKVTPLDIRHKAYEVGQTYSKSSFKASQNWYVNWKKRTGYECFQGEPVRTPKKTYTAAFKLQAVQRASQMESASQASLALNVSRRCLQRWKKEINIIATVAEEAGTAVYRRPGQGRKVNDSDLDANILSWIRSCWSEKVNVTPSMIRVKALEVCKEPNFKASIGWYVKFSRRYNLDLKERKCDSPVDKKDIEIKLKILPHDQTQNGIVLTDLHPGQPNNSQYTSNVTDGGWTDHFDRVLLNWVVSKIQGGEKVQKSTIRAKAMELCSNPSFQASQGWLSSWIQKHRLYNICGDVEDELSIAPQFSSISVYTHPHINIGRIPSDTEPLDSLTRIQSSCSFLQYDQSRTVPMSTSETTNSVPALSGEDLMTLASEVVEVASTEEVITDTVQGTVNMEEQEHTTSRFVVCSICPMYIHMHCGIVLMSLCSDRYGLEHIVAVTEVTIGSNSSSSHLPVTKQLTQLYCEETGGIPPDHPSSPN